MEQPTDAAVKQSISERKLLPCESLWADEAESEKCICGERGDDISMLSPQRNVPKWTHLPLIEFFC